MNNQDFKNELIQYVEKTYDEFAKYQKDAFDQLVEFDRICKQFDIPYFLAYGTLLGAIRDKGCIPWDYDIDVCVPITFRKKLIEVLNTSLNPDYYYHYKNNVKTYCSSALKLCKKGFVDNALHVDVYFVVGASEKAQAAKKLKKKLNWAMRTRLQKYKNNYYWGTNSSNGKYMRILTFIKSIKYKLIPSFYLSKNEEAVLYKYDYNSSKYVFITCNVYDHVFPAEIFKDTTDVTINGIVFKAPIGYIDFLKAVYGDYSKYPPIKSRFEEFYKMKNVVDDRQLHNKGIVYNE